MSPTGPVPRRRLARLGALFLSLGLPVAAAYALLCAIDATLLRQVPYPDADRLYRLRQHHPAYRSGGAAFAPAQIGELRTLLTSADLVAGIQAGEASIELGHGKERVRRAIVSRDYLEMIGAVGPDGRGGAGADHGQERHGVYLAHSFWLGRLGGERSVLGAELVVDGVGYLVEGVLPPVPLYPISADILLLDESFPGLQSNRADYGAAVLVRSRVAAESLHADLRRIAPILGEGITGPGPALGYRLEATPLRKVLAGASLEVLAPLQASAVALVVLGAFNAWCLWYVGALARHGEQQIRLALGAEPRRLMVSFLARCVGTSQVVTVVGICLGAQALPVLRGFLAEWSPRHAEITPSGDAALTLLASGSLLSLLAAAAAWHAAQRSGGADPTPRQRGFGLSRRQRSLQRLAIAAQAGVSFILLLAGLSAVSRLQSLRAIDLGFEPSGVIAAEVELPTPRYDDDEAVVSFSDRIGERLREALPRARVAVATSGPLAGDFLYAWILRVEADESRASEAAVIETRAVSESYFGALGATLVEGRAFDRGDRLRQSVVPVVVNEALVSEYWGSGRPALGRRLFAKGRDFTVVGIVRDIVEKNVSPSLPVLYVPFWMAPHPQLSFLVRADETVGSAASALRAAILDEEPETVALELTTMEERYAGLLRPDRQTAHLLSGLAATGFVLFVAGVGSLVFVESASRELEHVVRLVLGASRSRIAARLAVSLALTVAAGVATATVVFLLLEARAAVISFGPIPGSTLGLGALAMTAIASMIAILAAMRLPQGALSTVLQRE